MSDAEIGRSTSLRRNLSMASQKNDGKPRRQRSLVRPERERNDPNNRLYHYRQRVSNQMGEENDIAPSTTGNYPMAAPPPHNPTLPPSQRPLERKPTKREVLLRRGKSILGREEKHDDTTDGAIDYDIKKKKGCADFSLWMTYCRILTCCIPGPLLRCAGIPDGPAQSAWREKIGLVSFILCIMGFVGFLTFGFTQAVCPTPALSLKGGDVNNGYLIINGWAYMLASWNGHPKISYLENSTDNMNILYSAINAGGMDATFLFQSPQPDCTDVFVPTQGSQNIYFPCDLFNPNATVAPNPAMFTNQTACHLSSTARSEYDSFSTIGVPRSDGAYDKAGRVYYGWEDITAESGLTVYNGDVLNLILLQSIPTNYYKVPSGGLIETMMANTSAFTGLDITRKIESVRSTNAQWEQEAKCLAATIKVGAVDTMSIGCMASDIVLYVSLVVILGVIGIKFALAVIFGWFLSWKLGNFKEGESYASRMKRQAEIENWADNMQASAPLPRPKIMSTYYGNPKRKSLFPQTSRYTQPLHGSTRFDTDKGAVPVWRSPNNALEGHNQRQSVFYGGGTADSANSSRPSVYFGNTPTQSSHFLGNYGTPRRSSVTSSELLSTTDSTASNGPQCPLPMSRHAVRQPSRDYMPFNYPLAHTVCLVTCYSEGEAGIRITLDSIATSDYPNSHKLLLVICDGLITGSGETKSTPDICVGMMRDFIIPPDQVEPRPCVALADGSRQNNMAKVYAGFYKYDDDSVDKAHQQRVPMITIVKCGTELEANEPKPGNRGKRDSQIILMQFMQKVMFDERMTLMEYEFFNSIWRVAGVPPDVYEIVLMVDADTKLFPDALSRMISCAVKDPEISGLCGETKIANKRDSLVTMMQVFEYYISHHQSKAFESVFGGVTCLPGCFCMYRIKAPKGPDGYWVPILANPDIVERYSENVVDTLHKKNLLLLGEDRYLSTLMLRTFPNRKMMFVPQAVCKTVVPDTFMVLLSQRRRWINSTIHNLMELLFVHDLCGTFCFSMQFVIFMELVGTLALPAAISFTLYLIIMAILGQPAVLPLVLLALILGLPAVLIVMTSRKVVYVGWMIIYLFSLPIWNFVLPTYAYWHFDDFSWGDTRKVAGAEADKKGGHADKQGEFDSSQIVMKKWSEFEKERRINDAMERNMPVPKFADRNRRSIDVFRDSAFMKRYSKAGSTASTDSDIPLTQTGYDPAGLNKSIATYQNIRAYQNAGVRAMEESSGLESSTPPVESSTTDESVVSATPDIPLTLLHRTESSESSSSLGRSRGSYVASLAHSHIGNDDDDDDDDDEDSEDADAQTSFIQPNQQSNNNNNNLSIHNDWSNPAPHHNTHS